MKSIKIVCIILLSAATMSTYAQRFLVANDSANIVFIGILNPLTVVVEGMTCDEISLKTDNGTVRRWQDSTGVCRFVHTPVYPGECRLEIYKKAGAKTGTEYKVGSLLFKARYLSPAMSYDVLRLEWPE